MWNRLRDTSKKIVLYGTGNACERIMKLMEERGLRASAVFASDDFVRDRTFRGYKVESYSAVKERFGAENMIVLLCFGTHRPEVLENIERISGETELLAPDIAVIPEYGADGREILFDAECKEAHSAEIERVRKMLSDELSRQLFDSVISYRLSGELSYLKSSETPEKDIWEEAVSFAGPAEKERICLLDLGAYTGDTAELFTSVLRGKTARITAVEADDRNYIAS